MKLSSFTGGFVQTNCYLLESPDGNVLIDAPLGSAAWLDTLGMRIDALLLTHQHYDHVEDAAAFAARNIPIFAHSEFSRELTLENAARGWGLPISVAPFAISEILAGKDSLEISGFRFSVAHVPGHSVDSITFYLPAEDMLFAGDTLFAGSIGRADLPGGNMRELLENIDRHLMTLPGDTKVFPGHGPATTISAEAMGNPFLE